MSAILDAAGQKLTAPSVMPQPGRVHQRNKVPPKPVYPYVVYDVGPDQPLGYSLDVKHGPRMWRITWQTFSKTLEGLLEWDQAASDALLDQQLDAVGCDCGPMVLGFGGLIGATTRDPDDAGVLARTSSLIFTVTPQES